MICNVCKEKEATVHITKIVNGKKQELHLCEICAKSMENLDIGFEPNFKITEPFTFQSILSGIMDYVNKNSQNSIEASKELVCKNCGTSYSKFKKTGLLGCSECYKNFGENLNSVIRRVQGNAEHLGKIPKLAGKDILKKRIIMDLKEKLQKAIAKEEYEKAAEIRDKIREVEGEQRG
ncbi:UvrB/UvrC motif-containing protein [Haloimpatiens sp. FM7315]|uniref:UvrB/UvrC motif-containing protein n=1 Tax=Haloimpatiens sp. FM7315 TaxID=3298609 RepID=UPI0035A2E992